MERKRLPLRQSTIYSLVTIVLPVLSSWLQRLREGDNQVTKGVVRFGPGDPTVVVDAPRIPGVGRPTAFIGACFPTDLPPAVRRASPRSLDLVVLSGCPV